MQGAIIPPWVVAGDFIAILYGHDRINNGSYCTTPDVDFVECTETSAIFEPPSLGNYYTWKEGVNLSVHSKIDRIFINKECYNKFPKFSVFFTNHSTSDHTLIIFNFLLL